MADEYAPWVGAANIAGHNMQAATGKETATRLEYEQLAQCRAMRRAVDIVRTEMERCNRNCLQLVEAVRQAEEVAVRGPAARSKQEQTWIRNHKALAIANERLEALEKEKSEMQATLHARKEAAQQTQADHAAELLALKRKVSELQQELTVVVSSRQQAVDRADAAEAAVEQEKQAGKQAAKQYEALIDQLKAEASALQAQHQRALEGAVKSHGEGMETARQTAVKHSTTIEALKQELETSKAQREAAQQELHNMQVQHLQKIQQMQQRLTNCRTQYQQALGNMVAGLRNAPERTEGQAQRLLRAYGTYGTYGSD